MITFMSYETPIFQLYVYISNFNKKFWEELIAYFL
jgi:hypothetical protein